MSLTEIDADGWRLPEDPNDAAIRAVGDGTWAMRFVRFVPRPVEKVWAALTIPERVTEWLEGEAGPFDLRVGGLYCFKFGGPSDKLGRPGCPIVAYEPLRLLAFQLDGPGGDTTITWTLTPEANGCRLTFTQSGLTPLWFFGGMGGWHGMVDDVVNVAMDQPIFETEAYRDRVNCYERLLGGYVPGFDIPATLRHHEPSGVIAPNADGTYDVSFLRTYILPLAKAWAALTEPARLTDWMAEAEVDLRLGGAATFRWTADDEDDCNEIVALEPETLLMWRPLDGGAATVRFDLRQENALVGVRIVLTQTNIPADRVVDVAAGWHACLDDFPDAAVADAPRPRSPQRERARWGRAGTKHRPRYAARFEALTAGET